MKSSDAVDAFPNTRWTLVNRAANDADKDTRQACGELLELYWPALVAHLVYAWRIPREQAADVLHDFVADKVLERELLASADRERGKFRTFILTSLDHFIISKFRKEQTARRSPGPDAILSLEAISDQLEEKTGATPVSTIFDLAWIRKIIEETLRRVEVDCKSSRRAHYWALFEDRVINPILHGDTPSPYTQIVGQLGFSSPFQAANALVTVKRMFERTFRRVIQEYVEDAGSVDLEIKELYAILAEVMA